MTRTIAPLIRCLRAVSRCAAVSIALAAMVAFMLHATGAFAAGHHGHSHHSQAHHGHAHHGHHGHDHAQNGPAMAGPEHGLPQPADADLDWACCGSVACTAVVLATGASLACRLPRRGVTALAPSDPVPGFEPGGPRRPPRPLVLA